MKSEFLLAASQRSDLGKGASRRLRRAGQVPVIVYGGGKDPVSLTLEHKDLFHGLENEAFYSSIIGLDVDGKVEQAVLKDLQRHPARNLIVHADFQRVSADEKIRVRVALRFVGAEEAPGVRMSGGTVINTINEVEISCLPQDLPDFIEVDLSACELNESILMSDLKLPEGVELVELAQGNDQQVTSVQAARVQAVADEEEVEAAEGEEGEEGTTEEE